MPVLHKPDPPASSLLMMLVDDCPFQRILTATLLSRWGIAPLTASGGHEAIHLDDQHDFDIILMDLQMPDLDGFETARRIREAQRRRRCPVPTAVVAYTAAPLPLDANLMKLNGIDDVMQKPCDPSSMSRCLERWGAGKFTSSVRRVRGAAAGLSATSPP